MFSRAIRYFPIKFQKRKTWFEKDMNVQSFGTIRPPILGLPLGNPGKKWHLDVIPMERHIGYYREVNGVSPQRFQAMWSLCLKLSLLSPPHHFHSTYINCLFFLVVQVDIILNFCLWIHLSPISELHITPLPLKCYELRSVP